MDYSKYTQEHFYSEVIRTEYRKQLEAIDREDNHYVNAHINNISFPTTIKELEYYVYVRGMYDIEDILSNSESGWTVPRNAKVGDIVLFFHAKTAIARITALITQIKKLPSDTAVNAPFLLSWLEKARSLYNLYGGKIFAIARVSGSPEYWLLDEGSETLHWRGRVFSDIGDIVVLDTPIDISEFNSFIMVSRQSAITPLPSKEFNELRKIIQNRNDNLPSFFQQCQIGDYALSHISAHNFLTITQEYRRRFLLEIDFRSYYVDYVLKALFKRRFWRECTCYTNGKPNYFIDNVFLWNGRYYLLEVKLNILLERNLNGQLQQYINADYITLGKKSPKKIDDFERRFMYVIDTNHLYRYDVVTNQINTLVVLDDIKKVDDFIGFLP